MSSTRQPPLPPRLASLADAIEPAARVADVGTDHGRLPLWLARSGRVTFCLATEKDEARLRRAARPPADAPWARRLAYRAGDGLRAIRPADAVDTIVLAGLGGRTIVRLLGELPGARLAPRRLVLQPRTEEALVRGWLSAHGWALVRETLAAERGRLHTTLAAERGDDAGLYRHPELYRGDLLEAGPLLVRSRPDGLDRHWRAQRDRWAAIAAGASGPAAGRARAGLARAERILTAISKRGG